MEIKHIFADALYSFKYSLNGFEHEYDKKMYEWQDFEHVYGKAVENFVDEDNIDQFVNDVFWDREKIRETLRSSSMSDKLNEVFVNLHDNTQKLDVLEVSKAKFYTRNRKCSNLRVYALRVSSVKYIITGGAIKFTRAMQECVDTNDELKRLNHCRRILLQDSFIEDDLQDSTLSYG